jgi:hypothetical protein
MFFSIGDVSVQRALAGLFAEFLPASRLRIEQSSKPKPDYDVQRTAQKYYT